MTNLIVYEWKGKNKKGEILSGDMEAANEEAVKKHLVSRLQVQPLKIRKKPKPLFTPKVKFEEVIIFCRQFSTMIDAGLPLVQCLEILYSQQENPTFQALLKKVKEDVEGGTTLSDALSKYPKQFDELFVNMIAAGEAGGILDTILKRLSAYMEKSEQLKRKIKGALMYPIIVIAISAIVVGVILVFVIPVFQTMFEGMGRALPLPTQIVVNVSQFTKNNVLLIIGGLFGFSWAYKRFYASPKGRLFMDALFLRLPVFGILVRKVAVSKFARTISTMLGSGVAILDALDIVSKTSGNKVIENALVGVKGAISGGSTMADPLSETGVFPSMVIQMIRVGESTGAVDAMLAKIADFYEEEVDQAVENMTTMIEPLMIGFLGVTIGGLVVAMYLPVFQMAGGIE